MPDPHGLRIAVVTPTLAPIGGTELYVQSLASVQRDLGISTTFFVQQAVPGAQGQVVSPEISESISPLKWRRRAVAVLSLADRLAGKFDVVEFHRLAPLDLLRALDRRVPTLVYLHTPELTCPAGGRFLRASGKVCSRLPGLACLGVNLKQHCLTTQDGTPFPLAQRLRAVLRGPLSRRIAALCDGLVFNSRALAGLFETTVQAPRCSFVLEPPLHAPDLPALPRDAQQLLFVGRMTDFKGALDAVRVAALLPETRLRLLGDGPARAQAEALARQLGCESRVEFAGWASRDDVARDCRVSGCLLVPSRWFEAWGMTGPEAIAQGCPVVAYDVGGIGEWCLPQWGTLVPHGNVAAMADAARRWSAEDSPRNDWRKSALRLWGTDRFARQYADILRSLQPRGQP